LRPKRRPPGFRKTLRAWVREMSSIAFDALEPAEEGIPSRRRSPGGSPGCGSDLREPCLLSTAAKDFHPTGRSDFHLGLRRRAH
jgi:hypothetical protein